MLANSESWNGSAWTETADLNDARETLFQSGADNTAALAAGGETPSFTGNTELWNGSSWAEQNNLNTGRGNAGMTGTSVAALAFGGATPSATAEMEQWSASFPIGAWATSADMNNSNFGMGGDGAVTTAT